MITYQRETVEELLPDIEAHFNAHWDEVATYKEFLPDPDLERYRSLEKAGKLVLVTARDDDQLVGYAVDILTAHAHYKTMIVAANDMHFIVPSHRARCARGLTRFAEQVAKDLGAFVRTTRSKAFNEAGRFFEAMRYETVETVWGKRL